MSCQLTVLMAVYNGGAFLPIAIESILQQTYTDFHFLIVDDCSTDDTREVVRSYSDSRIELLCLEKNLGQAGALNAGLRKASTPWIARMDADDYSAPNRLEEQMRALEQASSLSCVGTYAWIFHDDPHEAHGEITPPTEFADIKQVLSGSPIIHGSIMVRREAILEVGAYDERYPIVADLDMFDRLLAKCRAATIPKHLLGVRRHSGQRSDTLDAYGEVIGIFHTRLSTDNYSKEQRESLRGEMSRYYLLRARYLVIEWRFLRSLKDIFSALRVSPKTFPMQFFVVSIVYNIPIQKRATLRRLIVRFAPGFKKW